MPRSASQLSFGSAAWARQRATLVAPWPLDRCARLGVDDDHIDQRVVDLHERQRVVHRERAHDRGIEAACRLATVALRNNLAGLAAIDPGGDRLSARQGEAAGGAAAVHLGHEVDDARALSEFGV